MPATNHALTIKYPARARAIVTSCWIRHAFKAGDTPPSEQVEQFDAIWDTGATGSVITQAVVDKLGLVATGITKAHGVQGEHETETYLANIILPNKVMFHGVRVTKAILAGFDVLIGMDIIARGDFAITNVNGETVMSFRVPSCETIDYCAANQKAAADEKRKALIKHRPKKDRKKKSR